MIITLETTKANGSNGISAKIIKGELGASIIDHLTFICSQ